MDDGGCPANTKYEAVTEIVESSNRVACGVLGVGRHTKFDTPDPIIGFLSWRVNVRNGSGAFLFIPFEYNFPKFKTHKEIVEALAPKIMPPAQLIMDPIPIDPVNPPPPPPSGRKIATYSEGGMPKAEVAWTAGMESGVTNSFGEVWINYLGPVTLSMLNFSVGELIEDETVEINAANMYM